MPVWQIHSLIVEALPSLQLALILFWLIHGQLNGDFLYVCVSLDLKIATPIGPFKDLHVDCVYACV